MHMLCIWLCFVSVFSGCLKARERWCQVSSFIILYILFFKVHMHVSVFVCRCTFIFMCVYAISEVAHTHVLVYELPTLISGVIFNHSPAYLLKWDVFIEPRVSQYGFFNQPACSGDPWPSLFLGLQLQMGCSIYQKAKTEIHLHQCS